MIRVAVNGAGGRMGAALVSLISGEEDMELAAALERSDHPMIGRDAGAAAGHGEAGVPLSAELPEDVDVLVDFSVPESTVQRAAECARSGTALVTGTTGLTADQAGALEKAAQDIPCLVAPNMSLGVNLMFGLAPRIAAALGEDYDVEIIEAHHRFKKDAPSGTGLKLAEKISRALGGDPAKDIVHGRTGHTGERPGGQIGMHSVRAGDIVGDHTVVFSCLGERVELTHRAHSRDIFCRGALAGARFVIGRRPGLYTMDHVLGLA